MLNIKRFACNMFQENCYVASDETKECVIIDCGALYPEEKEAIRKYIRDEKLLPKHLVCTHAHIDHNFGDQDMFDAFGLRPELCADDKPLIEHLKEQAKAFIGLEYDEETPQPGRLFKDGDTISFGSHKLEVIQTPGHTPGSVFLYCKEEGVAFSGDTLFKMSIGRTDFDFGSYDDIIASLQKVAAMLPADTVILPGHGEKTTMGFEAAHNPFLK